MAQEQNGHDHDPRGLVGWVFADKYKIVRCIASGGFGDVYEAYNVSLPEQKVVIKFLKRDHDVDKFQKEARILSLLDHPNICGIVDFFNKDRAIVVPFIDGDDCQGLVEQNGPLPEKLFLKVARTVLNTVSFAHQRQIAHRDIKPSNIMIDRAGHVYLIDFGIAKKVGGTQTKTGYQALTPQFAAPERQRHQTGYNPFLSDIYELGVTLYYLVAGRMPYSDAINPNPRWWQAPLTKPLSNRLLRVLRKAAHPDPTQRIQSAEEMAREMSCIQYVYRRQHVIAWLVGVAITMALIFVAYSYHEPIMDMWNETLGSPPAESTVNDPFLPSVTPDTTTVIEMAAADSQNASISDLPGADLAGTTKSAEADTIPVKIRSDGETSITAEAGTQSIMVQQSTESVVLQSDSGTKQGDQPPLSRQSPTPVEAAKTPSEETQDTMVTAYTLQDEETTETQPAWCELTVTAVPGYNTVLSVDDEKGVLNIPISVTRGDHNIRLYHPDYPILEDGISINNDTVIIYDLVRINSDAQTCFLQIGASPPLAENRLRVAFNGRPMVYKVPVRSLEKLKGWWHLKFEIVTPQGLTLDDTQVDSIAMRTGSRNKQRHIHIGNEYTMDLQKISEDDSKVGIVVFWTKR